MNLGLVEAPALAPAEFTVDANDMINNEKDIADVAQMEFPDDGNADLDGF